MARNARDVDRQIAAVAARQHSVFSREQAEQCHATPKQIAKRLGSGRWSAPHTAVYRLEGSPRTWRQDVMVAVLACGPHAVASHRTAAALLRIETFGERNVEVTTRRWARHSSQRWIVHESRTLGRRDVVEIDGIPTTSVRRTIADLAAVVPSARLETAIEDVLRRRLVKIGDLVAYAETLGRRRGAARLRHVLLRRDPAQAPTDVEVETLALAIVRRARLPAPVPQYRVYKDGRFLGRVDLAYPEFRIFIELDSSRHEAVRRRRSDLTRQNALVKAEWLPVRFDYWTVKAQRAAFVDDVRGTLVLRGWTPKPPPKPPPPRQRKRAPKA